MTFKKWLKLRLAEIKKSGSVPPGWSPSSEDEIKFREFWRLLRKKSNETK